ncbi:MAG TPA: carboxypeptidase regulatory-like domain-containing protein [Micromonosporaceae bacterium]|nr:carboxypeptidase regulatory-like domain-containing protein [Micromonosporaceae bacterium]
MKDRYLARRIRRWFSVAGIALALLAPMAVATPSPAAAAGSSVAALPPRTTVDQGTITGYFRTPAGAPIAGASVHAWRVGVPGGATAVAVTGADGAYSLVVPAASYRLEFTRREGGHQYAPRVLDPYDGDVFAVAAGASLAVDEIAILTGRITGRLVDAAGNPVVGADVVERDEDNMTRVAARTDSDGRFTIANVPLGRYRISFQLPRGFVGEQYVPRTLDVERATRFEVRTDETLTIDEQLLPTGTIVGRIADAAGVPLSGGYVEVHPAGGGRGGSVTTSPDGRFEAVVLAGEYKVSFGNDPWRVRGQYFFGARTQEAAAVITVAAGSSVTIEDRLLPTSEVRVTARDTSTGAMITNFCAYILGVAHGCSNGTGEVRLTGVVVGATSVWASAADGRYNSASIEINVAEGTTAEAVVPITPAALITTTVRDAVTGEPVPNACVLQVGAGFTEIPDAGNGCSDEQGVVRLGPLPSGDYTLFVRAPSHSPYGSQWVGRSGGTGDIREAVVVRAVAGVVTEVPDIRLDRAGSITGRVTTRAGGAAVSAGHVRISVMFFGRENAEVVEIDATGRYTIGGLGPYRWPLLFDAPDHPMQFSGGTINRYRATHIQVTAGGSTTFDAALVGGVRLTGTAPADYVHAVHERTGDIVGVAYVVDGRYSMSLVTPGRVRLIYGADDRSTGPITLPRRGTRTVNLP